MEGFRTKQWQCKTRSSRKALHPRLRDRERRWWWFPEPGTEIRCQNLSHRGPVQNGCNCRCDVNAVRDAAAGGREGEREIPWPLFSCLSIPVSASHWAEPRWQLRGGLQAEDAPLIYSRAEKGWGTDLRATRPRTDASRQWVPSISLSSRCSLQGQEVQVAWSHVSEYCLVSTRERILWLSWGL